MLKVIYGIHVVIVTPSISCNQVAPSAYQLLTFSCKGYVGEFRCLYSHQPNTKTRQHPASKAVYAYLLYAAPTVTGVGAPVSSSYSSTTFEGLSDLTALPPA